VVLGINDTTLFDISTTTVIGPRLVLPNPWCGVAEDPTTSSLLLWWWCHLLVSTSSLLHWCDLLLLLNLVLKLELKLL
jgi:hypothetical protein